MALPVYDSPTFLGAKDKYLMGLSLPQLMIVFILGLWWLMIAFMFPYETLVRFGIAGSLTATSAGLIFARISGLSIPMYIFYTILRMFSQPCYEERRDMLVVGNPVWLEHLEAGAKWYHFGFVRKKKAELETDEALAARVEMEAEVSKQVSNTAYTMEQWMREGIRTVMGNRR